MSEGELVYSAEVARQIIQYEPDAYEKTPEGMLPNLRILGHFLLTDEFPFVRDEFELRDTADVTRDDCIRLGRVAVESMQLVANKPKALTYQRLGRLYIMGLGISPTAYFSKSIGFKNMKDLKRAVGSPRGFEYGQFDSWSNERFKKEAAKVEEIVGGKPTAQDYRRYAAENPNFPSLRVIDRLVDGVGMLNEMLGYPSVRRWGEIEYLTYGVHVVHVNGKQDFTADLFRILASKKRGPTAISILKHFGTWNNYKQKVMQKIDHRKELLADYRSQIEDGRLPDDYSTLSEDLLLQRGARFEIINRLIPDVASNRKRDVADVMRSVSFSTSLVNAARRNHIAHITAGEVDAEARSRHLDDIIWPLDACYLDHIYVSDDELASRRSMNARKARKRAHAKR